MAKYRANAHVLGLTVGEEFDSNDVGFYAPFVASEYLTALGGGSEGEKAPAEPVAADLPASKPADDRKSARSRRKPGEGTQKP